MTWWSFEWTRALNLLKSNVYLFLNLHVPPMSPERSVCWQQMETLYCLQSTASVTPYWLPRNDFSMHSFQPPTAFWSLLCCISGNMCWHMRKCTCQTYIFCLMFVYSLNLSCVLWNLVELYFHIFSSHISLTPVGG